MKLHQHDGNSMLIRTTANFNNEHSLRLVTYVLLEEVSSIVDPSHIDELTNANEHRVRNFYKA